MIRFDILTIFPEMFVSPFQVSMLKAARENGLLDIRVHNIRDYAADKHHMTDDAPYGGGCGMVMKVEPIARALESIPRVAGKSSVILMTPQGKQLNQHMIEELASLQQLILICGHYEGVDERVRQYLADREISVGDYILTGGEIPAMTVIDAVSRLVPGVLGNNESAKSESFSMGFLEYPQYTRPGEYNGWTVPDILLSGHHQAITAWRRQASLKRTWKRRPDLLKRELLSAEDQLILDRIKTDCFD